MFILQIFYVCFIFKFWVCDVFKHVIVGCVSKYSKKNVLYFLLPFFLFCVNDW